MFPFLASLNRRFKKSAFKEVTIAEVELCDIEVNVRFAGAVEVSNV
jgi:hypothetical protein